MAASGYTPIVIYNSSTATNVPSTITTGELAINITDGKLFIGTGTNTYKTLLALANNATLTAAGSVTFSGAFTTGVTVTANTTVTLPVSGTLGYLNIPQNSQSAAYTTVLADAGKTIFHPAADANARTFTIDSNANVAYPLGTVLQFINMTSQVVTLAITSDTLTWAQGGGTGSRSLAQYAVANCIKIATTQWLLTGTNIS
jgi:hypothetical protein